MNMTDSDNDRLQQLELKVMEFEMTLHQLNDVVLTQYREIKQLESAQAALERRLSQVSDDSGGEQQAHPDAADEVPPHY